MAAEQFLSSRPVLSPDDASTPSGSLIMAASLTLKLLALSKKVSLEDANFDFTQVPAHVHIEQWQLDLINENIGVLSDLRAKIGTKEEATEQTTIAVCLSCGAHMFIQGSKTNPPSKCRMTLRCNGSFVKAGPAVARIR